MNFNSNIMLSEFDPVKKVFSKNALLPTSLLFMVYLHSTETRFVLWVIHNPPLALTNDVHAISDISVLHLMRKRALLFCTIIFIYDRSDDSRAQRLPCRTD